MTCLVCPSCGGVLTTSDPTCVTCKQRVHTSLRVCVRLCLYVVRVRENTFDPKYVDDEKYNNRLRYEMYAGTQAGVGMRCL